MYEKPIKPFTDWLPGVEFLVTSSRICHLPVMTNRHVLLVSQPGFNMECPYTESKVITQPITNGADNTAKQPRLNAPTCSRGGCVKKVCEWVAIDYGFPFHWMVKWQKYPKPIIKCSNYFGFGFTTPIAKPQHAFHLHMKPLIAKLFYTT